MRSRYEASSIADWFIERARLAGREIDHLSVQKLVYIAHGWCLGLYRKPLFSEPVEAWKFGPVVPSVYHRLKSYGSGPLPRPPRDPVIPDMRTANLLEKVWEEYGDLTAVQLVRITHRPGTPWAHTYEESKRSKKIDNVLILKHFEELAERGRTPEPASV